MNLKLPAVLAAAIVLISSCTSSRKALRTLQSDIDKEISGKKGTFAVAFKDLKTGKEIKINDKETFHAASTMKTPVMIEVYKQAAEGKFSLTDSIELKNEFKSLVDGSPYSLDSADDSEYELYKHIGEKRTISALLYQMIIVSSNFATNLIMQKVGAQNVTQSMRQLGAKDIQVLRGVEDNKAFEKGLNNTITAHDLMLIFEKIAKGEAVNANASQAMINILLDQKFNEIIPALLPTDVKVAHKTGSITHVHHDSGIVILPGGRKYVLVLLSKDWDDEKLTIQTMANISLLIYKYVTGK
ncbi:MAG TPA: serine hydrolase [Chitinophagaceae bacterium]|nr:serine hydrolase [Chitinophagaceae bacterium]